MDRQPGFLTNARILPGSERGGQAVSLLGGEGHGQGQYARRR
jgi:hypothetical protein